MKRAARGGAAGARLLWCALAVWLGHILPGFGAATWQQEQSAYSGHFESTCYHPRLLFNGERDCLAAKLRPGCVHSAEDWEELLMPKIERQQELGKEVVFRADAAFAKPEIYEALEKRGVKYAIRLPANAWRGSPPAPWRGAQEPSRSRSSNLVS